jgi:thioredoxin-like negative regulator of GroEL
MTDWFLVEFYAPWCKECQKLEDILSGAAKLLKEHSVEVKIGKVDTTKNINLVNEY